MPKTVSSFNSDTALNDVLVHEFVCRIVNNQLRERIKCYCCYETNTSFVYFTHYDK